MNKHYKRCSISNMPLKRPRGQSHLGMTKIPKDDNTTRGLHEVARLVYEDNLPIYERIWPSVLQSWFKKLKFANVTFHSLNATLESKYNSCFPSIKYFISKRSKTQSLANFFDKWRAIDNRKYIGTYIYVGGKSYCLGQMPYEGFCGSEVIVVNLRSMLLKIEFESSDFSVWVTDCGSDAVHATVDIMGVYHFACLAHVLNLIIKRLDFDIESDAEYEPDCENDSDAEDVDSDDENENHEQTSADIRKACEIVQKIHGSTKLQDKLRSLQQLTSVPELKIINENTTRWNSLLRMVCLAQGFTSFSWTWRIGQFESV